MDLIMEMVKHCWAPQYHNYYYKVVGFIWIYLLNLYEGIRLIEVHLLLLFTRVCTHLYIIILFVKLMNIHFQSGFIFLF